ncbi:hypothetical protein PFICI_06679 [Pestalotiopsis fici W106-1]|uniref:VIT domain-containing protein n=1 Tax=Pestalotiopsis fici (strain W106-1 / CGMCC3.15140) TaxID=1229662 RepID=W3X8E2_PESFW|nr:uncharacterized protein PFICI_06679 [Pestalotiopsis fici W106-1]ETS81677.1 hypothetical protein PFICI_06679 [Pestalotiopsis fici W106-1]
MARRGVCGFIGVDPVSHWTKNIPLARMDAHTTILASASRTTLTQTFFNRMGDLPELRYSFPLYDGVSVVGFTCTIGDRVITGIVKEKEEARQVYKDAVARGETAGLLDQVAEASDCFTTTIGNIPNDAEIKVKIVYVGELKHDAQIDGIRFTIPTIIAPRYGGYPGGLVDKQSLTNGSISITVDAEAPAGSHITSIQSPSHQLAVTMGRLSTTPDAEPSFQRASATLSLGTAQMMDDFILQVKTTNAGEPVAVLEEHPTIPNQRALMVTLVPKFELPLERPEIVFMCDRSGSMGGKEEDLRTALRIFVKSLRTGMKFNICSFGNNHTFLWERSQPYNQSTVDEAMKHIDTIEANYGGTEMYEAVKDIFGRRYRDTNLEVFLITDGQIWNQQQLLQLINQHVSESDGAIRLFSLGIGSGASHSLIEGVARAGQGFSQSVADREQMGSKVVRMLKGALFPHVKDYSLELKGTSSSSADDDFEMIEKASNVSGTEDLADSPATITDEPIPQTRSLFDPSVGTGTEIQDTEFATEPSRLPDIEIPQLLQAPSNIPPLFPFSRTSVYLLLSSDTPTPGSVILRGSSSHGPLVLEIPITVPKDKGETIHQLAAKKAVGELEEGRGWIYNAKEKGPEGQLLKQKYDSVFQDMVKREAVRLGVQYQVGGKWCSFVATEANGKEATEQRAPSSAPKSLQQSPGQMMQAMQRQQSPGSRPLGQSPATLMMQRATGAFGAGPSQRSSMLQGLEQSRASPKAKMKRARMGPQQTMLAGQVQQTQAQFGAAMPMSPVGSALFGSASAASYSSAAPTTDTRSSDGLQNFDFDSFLHQPAEVEEEAEEDEEVVAKKAMLLLGGSPTSSFSSAGPWGKPASPIPVPWVPSADPIQDLAILQNFEGYWTWDEKLSAIMGTTEQEIKGWIDASLAAKLSSRDATATVCVIAWLRKMKADEKDTWELIVEKALDWIKSEFGETSGQEIIACIPVMEKAFYKAP